MIVSRALIGAGLALMLFALGYEAANFPWQIYFRSDEDLNQAGLPDPPPLIFNEGAVMAAPEDNTAPGLPGAETLADFANGADGNVAQTVLGYLKIPKLGVSVNILAGSGADQLILGAGHVTETPMPDEEGNVCVAGHRVTAAMHPLRHMELMKPGDSVYIHYDGHVYAYKTLSVFVVENTETWVMDPVEGEPRILTLISCNPPGSARQRLILRARLIRVDEHLV